MYFLKCQTILQYCYSTTRYFYIICDWACPWRLLQKAVCCDDHEHCCPAGSTCDLASLTCDTSSGSAPMQKKIPAFVTEAPTTAAPTSAAATSPEEEKEPQEGDEEDDEEDSEEDKEEENKDEENKDEEGRVACDDHTSCPHSSTCCFMKASQKWGCCPLPKVSAASSLQHWPSSHIHPKMTTVLCKRPQLKIVFIMNYIG